jgi:hypothetical protein
LGPKYSPQHPVLQHPQSVLHTRTKQRVKLLFWTIGVLGFDSRLGLGIFLFTTASRMVLGPTQPPVQWVPGALSLRTKRPRRGADHSPPSSCPGERMRGAIPPLANTSLWRGA